MAKKTKKVEAQSPVVTKPPQTIRPPGKSVVSNEKLIKNGTLVNRGVIGVQRFAPKTKFWLANESYNNEFVVTEESRDSGTDHRHIRGGQDDVIVSLSYLQSQYGLGNLKLMDADGNFIENDSRPA